jgi:predicted unusual protein kinase regulating ubiquinone biosynthesis (AarF/ABC1/UbiB family)
MAVLNPLQKQRPPREALKTRQQEIEQCLVAFGVTGETGRRTPRPSVAGREPTQTPRLRQALEALGPIFSAFGLYMASRVDLLLVHERLDLAAITDWAEATPSATVRELIAGETGGSLERVYPVFEDEPCESRLLFQSHRAQLNGGKTVTVKVLHPELQAYLACDLELLPVLKPAFAGTLWCGIGIEDAIADFRHTLQWQIDLLYEVKVFEMLARDAQEFEILKVPTVYKELCSSQMLTIEQLSGTPLEEMIAASEKREMGGAPAVFEEMGIEPHTLARRLCMVWLRQALLGKQFPVALRPEDIVLLPNKQIAFTGGVFASLPSDAQKNLWHYMMATSKQAPDTACSSLLREIEPKGQPIDEDELRYRFREIVPFRDGGWRGSGDSSSLTEHLFVHWKLVSERGLRPQRHLLCFYRGLFQTLAMVRRFAPDSDPLLEGLQDVRTIVMLGQFQDMLAWGALSNNLDKYSTLLMELPQKFDHALTLMAESHARPPLQGTRSARHHGQRNSSVVVIALFLTLVAVVLLSRHLAISAIAGVWVDRVSAIAFVVLGALLLRAASRS